MQSEVVVRWLSILMLLPVVALAIEAPPPPQIPAASTVLTALPGCVYGAPVLQGDLWLVPRVCRVQLEGRWLDRQTVEARRGATRVHQASLPPTPVTSTEAPVSVPGELLPGAIPLLVLPRGIASVDLRQGQCEWVFEANDGLAAVARQDGLLAVAEFDPAAAGKSAGIQLTVLDLDAVSVLGETRLNIPSLDEMRFAHPIGGRLDLRIVRTTAHGRQELLLPVDTTPSQREQRLARVQARDLPDIASATTASDGCAQVSAHDDSTPTRPRLVVPADLRQAFTVRAEQRFDWRGPGRCIASGTRAPGGRSWLWIEQDSPPARVLRELR